MRLTYKRWRRAHRVFCRVLNHYGSHPTTDPELILIYDTNFKKVRWGWYQDGEVGVNFARCKDWEEVVGTIVHEVWHHLQDPKRTDRKRYEKEAKAVAKRDAWMFLVRIT